MSTFADRVKDTSSTTGTGNITLSGTPPAGGYQALAAIGTTGTTFPYALVNAAAGEWEVGTGTITALNTFSRSPTASSNGGSLVNFTAGPTFECVMTVSEFLNGAQKLTNKRIKPRVSSVTSSATPSVNTDLFDVLEVTALAVNITGITVSGTPDNWDTLIISIKDNGTAKTIAWNSSFEASSLTLPTTTVGGQVLDMAFRWNAASSKWRFQGSI